jgi:hypothetical protein
VDSSGVYRAGATPNVVDQVTVTDSLGNSATATIEVAPGVLVAPVSSKTPPGGTVILSASGGGGTGFTFALTTNRSGGTVDSSTGVYVAGSTAEVTDIVTVADALGNSATATIDVGAGVSLSAPSLQTPPGGRLALVASGGSGTYVFALRNNGSGAIIVSTTGLYVAGATAHTADLIEVTDDLGNSASLQISVGDSVVIAPSSPVLQHGGTVTFTASGGSGTGYVYSLTTNGSGAVINATSGVYVAGDTDDSIDVVAVTDSLGNVSRVQVAIGNRVALNPPSSAPPPRGGVQFTASGGSGTGYSFLIVTNSSGGTIDAKTGTYTAGNTPNVTDIVRAVDSTGQAATAVIVVAAGLQLTPVQAMLAPKGTIAFSVSGGSGSGAQFQVSTNGSGGTIDVARGDYEAGATGNTTDLVTVTDSLGNRATATVVIGKALSVTPANASVAPRGRATLVASGGAPPYAFSVATNRSGASVNPSTGAYVAGTVPQVADLVTVTDANGVSVSVTMTVTAGITVQPTLLKVAPGGTIQLTATGGGGSGYAWKLVDSSAGGSVDPATGLYSAAQSVPPGKSDIVEVTDGLGNTARVTIVPSTAPKPSPPSVKTVSASGGSGCDFGSGRLDPTALVWVLLVSSLVLGGSLRRRRRP